MAKHRPKTTGNAGRERNSAREQKRAQFTEPEKRSGTTVIAIVAIIAVAAIAAALVMARGGGDAATQVAATGGSVSIPASDVSDGQAHFYSYEAGGTTVKYFVVQSSDGTVRAAFDACDVCYPQKKGYRQEGDVMVCNNCGKQFRTDRINEVKGGCNPAPLTRSVEGDQVVIPVADLAAGASYF